jgi:hypothetical protein
MKVVFDDDHKVAISRICGGKGSLVIVYESMTIYVVDDNLSPIYRMFVKLRRSGGGAFS